jgi:hypothetical protein
MSSFVLTVLKSLFGLAVRACREKGRQTSGLSYLKPFASNVSTTKTYRSNRTPPYHGSGLTSPNRCSD